MSILNLRTSLFSLVAGLGLFASLAVLSPAPASAATQESGGWYADEYLAQVATRANSEPVFFQLKSGVEVCRNGSTSLNYGFVSMSAAAGANNDAQKTLLSMLISAKIANRKVRVHSSYAQVSPSGLMGCLVNALEIID